ncbi:UDP-N-acetylmuramoyl-L-alanyl-D-glutamate--2,6-diaminopimelate ligase [Candidatus Dependentiae bacterium]
MGDLPKTYPVACHTSNVGPGTAFVAIDGYKTFGTEFVGKAIKNGASQCVLSLKNFGNFGEICRCKKSKFTKTGKYLSKCVTCGFLYKYVLDPRKELAKLAAKECGFPAKKLSSVGITGTKGKTTSSTMVSHILEFSGRKTALTGSVHNLIGKEIYPSTLTTPGSDFLHCFLKKAVNSEVKYAVLEASSQGIGQSRLDGINFDVAAFTNLGHDHLDYHKTLDEYFNSKIALFRQCSGPIVINTDDDWGRKAVERAKKVVTFGVRPFDFLGHIILEFDSGDPDKGLKFSLSSKSFNQKFSVPNLFGGFNAYNAATSAIICHVLGLSFGDIKKGLESFPGVLGRMQKFELDANKTVFIDFAHTPDSMQAALSVLRPITENLTVVFGAGGNRDCLKRPMMGAVAEKYADLVFLTSDNPRDEDPNKIIEDIATGIKTKKVILEPDRKKAIEMAIEFSGPNSVIALLGKGNECAQVIKNETLNFSDFDCIKPFLGKSDVLQF